MLRLRVGLHDIMGYLHERNSFLREEGMSMFIQALTVSMLLLLIRVMGPWFAGNIALVLMVAGSTLFTGQRTHLLQRPCLGNSLFFSLITFTACL